MKMRFLHVLSFALLASPSIAQNVGVGMTTPGSKLTVRANGSSSATSALDVQNSVGGSLAFVRDDGRMGIGTNSPLEKLHVEGCNILVDNDLDVSSILLRYANTGATANSTNYISFENSAGNRWVQYQGGPNVGYFGVLTNAMEWWYYPFGAASSQCCHRRFSILPTAGAYNSNMAVVIDGIGQMYGNGWSQPSDSTLKSDITRIAAPMEKLKQIGGYTYRYRPETGLDNGLQHAGVLAQEVEAVLPEAVSPSPQGDFKTVNYDVLIPLMIEAMKEQQATIEAQGREIAAQRAQLEQLAR